MNGNLQKYGFGLVRVLLTLAFLAAGLAKLSGVEMMVATFDAVGLGQWFRYLTGAIEIGAAILLWLPGLQLFGAATIGATMVGAVLTHAFIIGPSALPATALGLMSALLVYRHRDQVPGLARPA